MNTLLTKIGLIKKKDTETSELKDQHAPPPRFPWILVKYIGADWILILLAAIFQGAGTAAPIFFYVVFQTMTDTLISAANQTQVFTLAMLRETMSEVALNMTYIALGVGVANGLAQIFQNLAKVRVGNKIKRLTLAKLVTLEMGYYDVKQSGDILSHVNEDAEMIIEAWTIKLVTVCGHMVTFVVGVALSFEASWIQTLVMGACIPPMMVGALFGGIVYLIATKKASDSNAKCVAVATEVVSSMKTVRSMAGESKEKQRFAKHLNTLGVVSYLKSVVIAFAMGLAFFAIWGIVALSFWFGGILITTGIDGKYKITVGDMFQIFGVSLFAVLSIAQAATEIGHFYKSLGAAYALSAILHRYPQIRPYKGKIIPKDQLKGKIEFKNVSFAYPSRPDITVLHDFSLTIEPGTQVAFVGESGSGKSTIVALIENLYQPYQGDVLLDGYNIKDLDPIWLHRTIGIVTQEPVLFAASIIDNVLYAIPEAEVKTWSARLKSYLVENALDKANALDFCLDLPEGLETIVGERGSTLSGGQKQRIAIARAMIQDPQILLLDEATSALDNESEKLVQAALDKLLKSLAGNRTSISIAHRLSTIQDCDVIVVMKKGVVVEKGTHHDLLEKDGHYKALATKQMMSMDVTEEDSTMMKEAAKLDVPVQSTQVSVEDESIVVESIDE